MYEVRSFKVFGNESQLGANACGKGDHNCSHLCVMTSSKNYTCLCPDGLEMNESGVCACANAKDMECFKRTQKCPENSFQCISNGGCVSV